MEAILFYNTRGPYGSFTNFSRDPVTIFGRTWATSEAAFQAMKFHPHRPDLVQKVFDAEGPKAAATLGRNRDYPMNPDWEKRYVDVIDTDGLAVLQSWLSIQVDDSRGPDVVGNLYKDAVMFIVVLAKVVQTSAITDLLLSTGEAGIIEDTSTSNDAYWGWGSNKDGVNRLGKIFMGIRKLIQAKGVEGAKDLIPLMAKELDLPV